MEEKEFEKACKLEGELVKMIWEFEEVHKTKPRYIFLSKQAFDLLKEKHEHLIGAFYTKKPWFMGIEIEILFVDGIYMEVGRDFDEF